MSKRKTRDINERIEPNSKTTRVQIAGFLQNAIADIYDRCLTDRKQFHDPTKPFIINEPKFIQQTSSYLYDLVNAFFAKYPKMVDLIFDYDHGITFFACTSDIIGFDIRFNTDYPSDFSETIKTIVSDVNNKHPKTTYIEIHEPATNFMDDVLPSVNCIIKVDTYNSTREKIEKAKQISETLTEVAIAKSKIGEDPALATVFRNPDLRRNIMSYLGGKKTHRRNKKTRVTKKKKSSTKRKID
jgi:hypothetical protein